jgi:Na+/phosphate symporter
MYYVNSVTNRAQVEELCEKHSTDRCTFYVVEDDAEEDPVSEIGYTLTKDVKESLTEATIYTTKAEMEKLDKEVAEATQEVAKYNIPMKAQQNSAGETENVPDFEAVPEAQREAAKKAYDRYSKAIAARPDRLKNVIKYTDIEESLTEDIDKDLDAKLKAHNDYIEYLKNMIKQEEESLKNAENEFVKKAIQRRLDAFKADLEEALPEELKTEVEANNDLPTPEEVDMEARLKTLITKRKKKRRKA